MTRRATPRVLLLGPWEFESMIKLFGTLALDESCTEQSKEGGGLQYVAFLGFEQPTPGLRLGGLFWGFVGLILQIFKAKRCWIGRKWWSFQEKLEYKVQTIFCWLVPNHLLFLHPFWERLNPNDYRLYS